MTTTIPDNVVFTLDDAVQEVLGILTGLELSYVPELDRYYAITRAINRALRENALEHEWSYYVDDVEIGVVAEGDTQLTFSKQLRPRIGLDESVKLKNADGLVVRWAYYLPRGSLSKYRSRGGLWVSYVRNVLLFSRSINSSEDQLTCVMPAMREPVMFDLPTQSEDPADPLVTVDQAIRDQELDFAWPDVITARAAWIYAQTDPVMQPRAQTLEARYKDLMYNVIGRDTEHTDSPYANDFFVPVRSGLHSPDWLAHGHPHSDERRI